MTQEQELIYVKRALYRLLSEELNYPFPQTQFNKLITFEKDLAEGKYINE